MKNVPKSEYIAANQPLLKELLDMLLGEYPYASILAVDSKAKRYSVSRSGINISEQEMLSTRGFVVKVYDGKSYGEYSFNEISRERLPVVLEKLRGALMPVEGVLPEGIGINEYAQLSDEAAELDRSTTCAIHPDELDDKDIIERLASIRTEGMESDERVLDISVNFSWRCFTKLFLSANRELCQNVMWANGAAMAMAKRGEEIKDCYKGYSVLGGAELLDEMSGDICSLASTAVSLLDSQPIEPGEYDCICTPDVTGMIVHEAFGHGVEMDMFVKDRAQAKQFIGQYVASPLVTMRDGAAAVDQTATYFFDDEGVLAHDTKIIDKGILVAGISDAQSAMFLGTEPTGNGRRESYTRKAYTRMTNTFFEGGSDKYEDMLASIEYGFQLENASSGMEDPKNWGIQCMVTIAREIKDGKFTGRIFSPIVLTGYVPDLLKSISMMSENAVLSGSGFCGKGYKEWVKVSDGGPYIKARIRLG